MLHKSSIDFPKVTAPENLQAFHVQSSGLPVDLTVEKRQTPVSLLSELITDAYPLLHPGFEFGLPTQLVPPTSVQVNQNFSNAVLNDSQQLLTALKAGTSKNENLIAGGDSDVPYLPLTLLTATEDEI